MVPLVLAKISKLSSLLFPSIIAIDLHGCAKFLDPTGGSSLTAPKGS
jgi:hypothetical protein